MFVNFKLFVVARKVHREGAVSPGKRTTINLKNISMGLWVFAFLILLYIPEGILHCVWSCWEIYKHYKIVFYLGFHICHHELHIEQFDLFLEEQSFTHRRNKLKVLQMMKDRLVRSWVRTLVNLLCFTILIWCRFIFKLKHIRYKSYNRYNICHLTLYYARIVNSRYNRNHIQQYRTIFICKFKSKTYEENIIS